MEENDSRLLGDESMAETPDPLFAEYNKQKALLTKVEQGIEVQKKRVQGVARAIFEAKGKGPHDIGDGRPGGYVVAVRKNPEGDVYFLTPADKRGDKSKQVDAAPTT